MTKETGSRFRIKNTQDNLCLFMEWDNEWGWSYDWVDYCFATIWETKESLIGFLQEDGNVLTDSTNPEFVSCLRIVEEKYEIISRGSYSMSEIFV